MIPKFDKSKDDRSNKRNWQKVKLNRDIIIFEGWCVGAKGQKSSVIKKPINMIEENTILI